MTLADNFFSNGILEETAKKQSSAMAQVQMEISGVRPPDPKLLESYKKYLDLAQDIRGRNLFYPYIGSGVGSGPYVELMDGSIKLDLINGIGIHLFGHSHPEIIQAALSAAMQDVVMQGNLQPNREYVELLDLLVSRAGKKSRLKKGWIGTCGTIVNENALKIVRQKNSPARKILAFKDAFAGRSTMMAEITDNPEYRQGLPEYKEVLYIPFYHPDDPKSPQKSFDAMKKHIADNPKDIACFMFEIIQGEGGFNIAPREFFVSLFELCRENGIAIWADEVQTFARTGELFAFEKFNLGEYVDVVTIAKTIQCGAVLYTNEYNPKPGLIAGTYTASTVSLKTGLKVLNMLINENYLGEDGRIAKIHREFTNMLKGLKEGSCRDLIQGYGGMGLMVSMTPYDGSKDKVMKLLQILFKKGLLAFSCGHGPYKLRFLLPAILNSKHIEDVRVMLEEGLKEGAQG